jgi:glucose-6-phosphate isomerase
MTALKFDFANCFSAAIGEKGLDEKNLAALREEIVAAVRHCNDTRGEGMTGWYELPYETEQVEKILNSAAAKKGKFDDVVVLGIGGSALGTIALRTALVHPFHNMLPNDKRGGLPRLHVLDNIDPDQLAAFFADVIDFSRTLFIVISKSGSTAETMSQFLLAVELIENKLGKDKIKDHLIAITDKAKGVLRPIADDWGLESYVIDDGVGGRFSVLSPVGLLPAALCGMDIEALLAGAAEMDEICKTEDFMKNPAALFAAIHFLADRDKNARLSVMMPYASGLKDVADWYCQLWAESLGKAVHDDGTPAFVGSTPVKALGATDQHSQVQMYTEGPFDKVTVFVGVEKFEKTLTIPSRFGTVDALAYLNGRTFNELMDAERVGTELALCEAHRMNMTITLPEVNANTVGQLFFMLEVATAIAGKLYKIDAFNQPGVEGGKIAAYAQMGRKGYEAKAKEIAARPAKNAKFLL